MLVTEKLGIGRTIFLKPLKLKGGTIHNLQIKSIHGTVDFSGYEGKKILIVNLASRCGFTPQYEELELLYKKYQGKIVILGFPSNSFANQEPGSDEEISQFCLINYGVSFQLFPKGDVKGDNMQEVYRWLTDKSMNGWNDHGPTWNFYKYLLDENGILTGVYSPAVSPLSKCILKVIEA